jgi:outer membrane protein OmpA-like peptidoglycan-associated protein
MSLSFLNTPQSHSANEEHWIPLSDLMTGLMMMFMLIAVLFMLEVEANAKKLEQLKSIAEQQAAQMRKAAELYDEVREQLYNDLRYTFKDDLPKWHAVVTPDLAVRFEEPSILFDDGQWALKQNFKDILATFFPRYVAILSSKKYRSSIEEIRIEGHTSSVWNTQTTPAQAYFNNMKLSQDRTRSTLEYVIQLPKIDSERRWVIAKTTANGLSSSRLRLNADGTENRKASQRVEFRVRTNAEERIGEILRAGRQK